jgi:hypothetical protein
MYQHVDAVAEPAMLGGGEAHEHLRRQAFCVLQQCGCGTQVPGLRNKIMSCWAVLQWAGLQFLPGEGGPEPRLAPTTPPVRGRTMAFGGPWQKGGDTYARGDKDRCTPLFFNL